MAWQEPQFDKHAFAGKRTKAVSADTEISFQDFGRMHVHKREKTQERRLPIPEWAKNDSTLREVVLRFAEDRLFIKSHSGTDAARVAFIDAEVKRRLPRMQEVLASLQRRYKEAASGNIDKLVGLAMEVQNRDSEIVIYKRGLLALALSVAYLYYRNGWDSVVVAQELQLKSPMVRQWTRRMNIVAGTPGDQKRKTWATPENLQRLLRLRFSGHSLVKCAQILGVGRDNLSEHWKRNFLGLKIGKPKQPKKPKQPRKPREPRERSAPTHWSPERIARLAALRNSGKTWQACADALSLNSPSTAIAAWHRHCK